MFSSLHLASFLLFLSFFEYSVVFSQDPNLFLDPLPATGDNMDLLASSSLSSDPPPDNLLGDGTVNNMFIEDDPLLQAYCAKSNQQPGKARARRGDGGVVCSPGSSPAPPLTVPEFPDLLNSISGPGSSGEKFKNEGDVVGSFTLNTAEFYCSMFTSQPQLFIIPICGSGNYMDSVRIARAFYSTVFKSWLITTATFASCLTPRVFCCMQWVPDLILRPPNEIFRGERYYDSDIGTGYNCENLLNRGWKGLYSEDDPDINLDDLDFDGE